MIYCCCSSLISKTHRHCLWYKSVLRAADILHKQITFLHFLTNRETRNKTQYRKIWKSAPLNVIYMRTYMHTYIHTILTLFLDWKPFKPLRITHLNAPYLQTRRSASISERTMHDVTAGGKFVTLRRGLYQGRLRAEGGSAGQQNKHSQNAGKYYFTYYCNKMWHV